MEGADTSSLHDKSVEQTLPLWSQMKNLLPLSQQLYCELWVHSYSPKDVEEWWGVSCSWTLLGPINDRCVWSCIWQRTGTRRWQKGNNEMPPSLRTFPLGYCLFQIIIVVRDCMVIWGRCKSAFEWNGSCGWCRTCSSWSWWDTCSVFLMCYVWMCTLMVFF